MQSQIIHLATSLVLCGLYAYDGPYVFRLATNSNPPTPSRFWNIQDSGFGDNTIYICSDYFGTCLGNLRIPLQYDFVGADYKNKATGKQLVWYYNRTDQTLAPAERPGLVLTARDIPKEPSFPALELWPKYAPNSEDAASQRFIVMLATRSSNKTMIELSNNDGLE